MLYQLDVRNKINNPSLILEYLDNPINILHFDRSKLVPFIQPLHRLQSFFIFSDIGSLQGIEEAGVEYILIKLGPDSIQLLVLTGHECVTDNVVNLGIGVLSFRALRKAPQSVIVAAENVGVSESIHVN